MYNKLRYRCVVQRAKHAEVCIDGVSQGKLDYGLVVFLGFGFAEKVDTVSLEEQQNNLNLYLDYHHQELSKLVDKLLSLRIFQDEHGKMNHSVKDIEGGLYIISQFTLFADCSKSHRPHFLFAANKLIAEPMYEKFLQILKLKAANLPVFHGQFAADMKVSFCNDGPVTLIIESDAKGIV